MTEVVVVIGVGGMGEIIARRQGTGRRVVVADFSEETLDRVSNALQGDGYEVDAVTVDVSSPESLRDLAAHAASLGSVTQVAHTAGLSPAMAPTAAILAVDAAGVAHSLDAFGEVIAEGGAGVYIASMAGHFAAAQLPTELEGALRSTASADLLTLPFLDATVLTESSAAYGLSKRANQLRIEAAATQWGTRGARVNSISPGIISTPMGQQELGSDAGQAMRAMITASGTHRIGTPTDIADAAAFLLGPASTFITGTDLLVDGGVIAAFRSGALQLSAPQ